MDWKNQLTKTPYLVLFIVLISIGVGTASALITITLAGDVHVTGNTILDGTLGVGINNPNDDDFILFDDGNEFLFWDDSQTQFEFRDDIVTGDVIQAGNAGSNAPYSRIGIGTADSGAVTANDDLYIKGNLETDGDIYCPNCILGRYTAFSATTAGNGGQLTLVADCDPGDIVTGGGFSSNIVPTVNPARSVPAGIDTWRAEWRDSNPAVFHTALASCLDFPPAHVP